MSYFDQPRRAFQRRNHENQKFSSPRFNQTARPRGAVARTDLIALGRVKWFSAEKGFGFVALEDGTDVFLHGSVLTRAGFSVNPGDAVRVGVGQGLKGRQVTEVLEVTAATVPAQRHAPTAGSVRGVVKWWNSQKGFGFITPEAGEQDIFVHASTATRAGLTLEQGMPVRVTVRQGLKGPEAIEIAST